MIRSSTESALARQYVKLYTHFVTSERWAELWSIDEGLSTTLFPVLAVLGGGYDAGAFARRDKVRTYTGLSHDEVQRGLSTLVNLGLVADLRPQNAASLHFQVNPHVIGRRGDRKRTLAFPGMVLLNGAWANMSGAVRNLFGALLALADKRLYLDKIEPSDYPRHVHEWINRLYLTDDDYGNTYAPRVGHVTIDRVSLLTGLPGALIPRLIRQAEDSDVGDLLHGHRRAYDFWYQLGAGWDVPNQPWV